MVQTLTAKNIAEGATGSISPGKCTHLMSLPLASEIAEAHQAPILAGHHTITDHAHGLRNVAPAEDRGN